MNNFEQKRINALEKWDKLMTSKVPVIYLGSATCGRAAGALKVLETIRKVLKANNLKAKIVQVGCIGPCYLEPLMDIKMPGQPRISYANVNPEKVATIIESYLIKGDPKTEMAMGYFDDNGFELNNGLPKFFDIPMLKPQVRLVLRNCGFIDPESIDHYLANDGYAGLIKAFEKGPEQVIADVKEAGLRGRGGAGFPTFKKWEICRAQPGPIKYMICNSSEGDPGAFMNRSLIESDPHAVLEGLLIAAYAIGANHGYIYINSEYFLAIDRLKIAVEQMKEYGLLGKNILGSGFDFDIIIKEGAGAFVCGEETALIGAIEGRRGMPKYRPPFPAIAGLHAKPIRLSRPLPVFMRNRLLSTTSKPWAPSRT